MLSRVTLSNREGNYQLLLDFIRKWAQERGLSATRRDGLEQAAEAIFRQLLAEAYRPYQPGSIAVELEEKGARLRLMFEDDAPPYVPTGFTGSQNPGPSAAPGRVLHLNGLQPVAESLIYYRTADRKNRLVVFLT